MLINAYYRNDFSYSVESGGITNRDAVMVSMKVDTGSPYTIISLDVPRSFFQKSLGNHLV